MKKLLLFAFLLAACVACDDNDNNGPEFETENDEIVNGQIVDDDAMVFLGTSTVTNPDGTTFVDENARFIIVGDGLPSIVAPATTLTVYMRQVRFAAAMPGIEMRMRDLGYTPGITGPNLTFANAGPIVPQASIAGTPWADYEKYAITDLDGAIANVNCRISFTCMGAFRVVFEGRMLDD